MVPPEMFSTFSPLMASSATEAVIVPLVMVSTPLPASVSLDLSPSPPDEVTVILPPLTVRESLPRIASSTAFTVMVPDWMTRSSLLTMPSA